MGARLTENVEMSGPFSNPAVGGKQRRSSDQNASLAIYDSLRCKIPSRQFAGER
jgi:hypothetical protein